MSELERYTKAMIHGPFDTCVAIEQKHGMYGYPPEIVSAGLRAIDEGRDPDEAIDAYLSGETP